MRAAPRPEPIRKSPEVLFVDGIQHFDGGALDDLVFQRGNAERSSPGLPTFGMNTLRTGLPPQRRRPVRGDPGLVRRLRRYFGTVRLPASIHHRRTSFDFPMRPVVLASAGGRGIPRFPHKVFPYMLGFAERGDRAGPRCTSRERCAQRCLPPMPRASASRSACRLRGREWISRLNTRPVRSPVNASPPLSRATTHDPGPLWFATPSTYETFIHYTLPVLTGARAFAFQDMGRICFERAPL